MSPTLELAIERERFRLSDLAFLRGSAPATLDSIESLAARLPRGLVHAEEILCVPRPPLHASAIAPGSAWFARDRTLITRTAAGTKLALLLRDLAEYQRVAEELARRAAADPSAGDAISGERSEGLDLTRAAILLGTSEEALRRAKERSPEALLDLRAMVAGAFDPMIRIHPELVPSRVREAAGRAAELLLREIQAPRFDLVAADSPWVIDLLSPYPRDLGHALFAWGLENGEKLGVFGLYEALLETRASPTADLSALVARELLEREPDLLEERRQAERTQGLVLWDEGGTTYGLADLRRLAAPDEAVGASAREGVLAVLAGHDAYVVEIARALFLSGRVERVAAIAGMGAGDRPVVPCGLLVEHDGMALSGAERLLACAESLGVSAARRDHVVLSDPGVAPAWLFDLLASHRRAAVLDLVPSEAEPLVVLHPRGEPSDFSLSIEAFRAARIAVRALLDRAPEGGRSRANPPDPHGRSRITRRFRA